MTNEKQLTIIAHLVARPGKEEALMSALLDIVPKIKQEPGCVAYVPHVSRDHPRTIVMYEVWEDEASHKLHKSAPLLAGLSARFDQLLEVPLRTEALRRLG